MRFLEVLECWGHIEELRRLHRELRRLIEEMKMAKLDTSKAEAALNDLDTTIASLKASITGDVSGAVAAAKAEQAAADAGALSDAVAAQLAEDQAAHDDVVSKLESEIVKLKEATVAPLTVDVSGVSTSAPLGTAFTGSVVASGGVAPVTLTATGLPDGLSMDTSGAVSGTPGTSGSFAVGVTATDAGGATAIGSFSMTVA